MVLEEGWHYKMEIHCSGNHADGKCDFVCSDFETLKAHYEDTHWQKPRAEDLKVGFETNNILSELMNDGRTVNYSDDLDHSMMLLRRLTHHHHFLYLFNWSVSYTKETGFYACMVVGKKGLKGLQWVATMSDPSQPLAICKAILKLNEMCQEEE